MTGDLGFWEIKPDQMQVINPLLILVFIPLYEVVFYPLLSLIGIRRPLQKLTLGGIFAGIAFVISAIVEINLSNTYPVLPNSNEGQLRMFNGKSCDYTFSSNIPDFTTFSLKANDIFEEKFIKVENGGSDFRWTITSATPAECQQDVGVTKSFNLPEKSARSFFMSGETREGAPKVDGAIFEDSAEKSRNGRPFLRVLANINSNEDIRLIDEKGNQRYNKTRSFIGQDDYPSNTYTVFIGSREILKNMEMKLGGVYAVLINERVAGDFVTKLVVISEPNSMNMLWLIPQYVVMTLGEVLKMFIETSENLNRTEFLIKFVTLKLKTWHTTETNSDGSILNFRLCFPLLVFNFHSLKVSFTIVLIFLILLFFYYSSP